MSPLEDAMNDIRTIRARSQSDSNSIEIRGLLTEFFGALVAYYEDARSINTSAVAAIVRQYERSLLRVFRLSVERIGGDVLLLNTRRLSQETSAARLANIIGPVVDSVGDLIASPPPLYTVPSLPRGDNTTLGDILSRIAPLLHVNRKGLIESKSQVVSQLREPLGELADPVDMDFRDGWDKQLAHFFTAASIRYFTVRSRTPTQICTFLGLRGSNGILQRLQNIMQHEALRIREQDTQREYEKFDIAGYELHSSFSDNTRDDHISNDGNLYFRDNRPESTTPWAQRLIPPYAPFCMCSSVRVYDDVQDPYPLWKATPRRGSVLPRDPAMYATWFDRQRNAIQQIILGMPLWTAARLRAERKPRYVDVIGEDGEFINSVEAMGETSRTRRITRVTGLIERSSGARKAAVQGQEDRFTLTADQEAENRKNLI